MRLVPVVALILIGVAGSIQNAQAQPLYPVLLVHGLNSNEVTWAETVTQLEAHGWGPAYAMHFDLNRSATTLWSDDIVHTAFIDYWEFYDPDRLVPADTARVAVGTAPVQNAPETRRSGGSPRLFAVNFETYYDADDDEIYVGQDRDLAGHSESNCSAAAKQGAALSTAIADILTLTGSDKVVLMGHSMGGLAIREYLQRTDTDGAPRWWVSGGAAGHRVASAITYGTPHQGSNFADPFGFACATRSEAYRDIRYTYTSQSPAEPNPYLYGGSELVGANWFNLDYDADGAQGSTVQGLNEGDPNVIGATDNPAMPLPEGIQYVYIHSGSDGLVTQGRQYIVDTVDGQEVFAPAGWATGIETNRTHVAQTSDWQTISAAVLSSIAVGAETGPADGEAITVWPNPARGRAAVGGRSGQGGEVHVQVLDLLGRRVLSLAPKVYAAGDWSADLDLSGLAPGVYSLAVRTSSEQSTARLTVVR